MKKANQIYKKQTHLDAEQTFQFLEDFSQMIHGRDKKTKPISLRIPENVLTAFKFKAQKNNQKYQSVIVKLMREWAQTNVRDTKK